MKLPWKSAVSTALLLSLAVQAALAAPAPETVQKVKTEYLAALGAMASYNDRAGAVARTQLTGDGWTMDNYDNSNAIVSMQYMIATKPAAQGKDMLLAVSGSSGVIDTVDTHLDLHAVSYTKGNEVDANDPLAVHEGINNMANTILDQTYHKVPLRTVLVDQAKTNSLLMTGDNVGGSTVELLGARLSDLGINSANAKIVSFGAPAVGNQAFNDTYQGKLNLDRVIMAGDSLKNKIPAENSKYTPLAATTTWKDTAYVEHSDDTVINYGDAAMHAYYDLERETTAPAAKPDNDDQIYVMDIQMNVDTDVAADIPYMKMAIQDLLQGKKTYYISTKEQESLDYALARAEILKLSGVQQEVVTVAKMREDDEYRVTVEKNIYRTSDGTLVQANQFTTVTKELSPLLAVLYCQMHV